METQKRTAVANAAAELMPFDISRLSARVQNPLASPIYLSKANPPLMTIESIYVPPASTSGIPGEWRFDDQNSCYEQWFYITAASGDFGLRTW